MKAVVGFAALAMGMERPLRISMKEDVWAFGSVLDDTQVPVPYHQPWATYDKIRGKHPKSMYPPITELRKGCFTAKTCRSAARNTQASPLAWHLASRPNITLFYQALGGETVVNHEWLADRMRERNISIPDRFGKDFLHMCVSRMLFQPHARVVQQLQKDIGNALDSAAPLWNSTFGARPTTLVLGMHARYSGKAVEAHAGARMQDRDVRAQIACSWDSTAAWASELGSSAETAVWLIASDRAEIFFAQVKKFLANKAKEQPNIKVKLVHATTGKAKHIKHDASDSSVFRLWLDWFLLNEAAVCSYGRSGFPETACLASRRKWLTGGKSFVGATSKQTLLYCGACNSWNFNSEGQSKLTNSASAVRLSDWSCPAKSLPPVLGAHSVPLCYVGTGVRTADAVHKSGMTVGDPCDPHLCKATAAYCTAQYRFSRVATQEEFHTWVRTTKTPLPARYGLTATKKDTRYFFFDRQKPFGFERG